MTEREPTFKRPGVRLPRMSTVQGARLVVASLLVAAAPAVGQLAALRFDPLKVPVGRVYQYLKSIPDEPGFTDGRLRLLGVERMTPAEWESFQRARLGE